MLNSSVSYFYLHQSPAKIYFVIGLFLNAMFRKFLMASDFCIAYEIVLRFAFVRKVALLCLRLPSKQHHLQLMFDNRLGRLGTKVTCDTDKENLISVKLIFV